MFRILWTALFCSVLGAGHASAETTVNSNQPNSDEASEGISKVKYFVGAGIGTGIGFGIGHAVQGRWKSTGWIFSALEGVSYAAVLAATAESISDSLDGGDGKTPAYGDIGLAVFLGVHIWEIYDVWKGVERHDDGLYYETAQRLYFAPTLMANQQKFMPGMAVSLRLL